MKLDTIHVRQGAQEDPQRLMVVRCPQSGGSIVRATYKVVSVWGEADVPYGELMTLVDHQTGPGV